MEKFVPMEKRSKKAQRAANNARRTMWGISPVTRRPENPAAYNRAKSRARALREER